MRFLLDNNLPPSLARGLHELAATDGHEVYALRAKFPPDTPDVEWLGALGDEGRWVVVSADQRISRNKHEKEAWLRARVTVFFLKNGWRGQDFWGIAWRLVKWWPEIVQQASLVQPGAGFVIPQRGSKFEQVHRS